MNTINNMAKAAAQAVWGEQPTTEEPVSGKTGDVSKGEPYDAGNIATPAVEPTPQAASTEEPVSGKLGDVAKGEPYDAGNMETKATGTAVDTPASTTATPTITTTAPTPATETPKVESTATETPKPTATLTTTTSTETAAGAAPIAEAETKKNPATELDSSITTGDSSKVQQDTRDPTEPAANPEDPASKTKQNVDNSAPGGVDKDQNPDKVDGPGPRPIEEVAKEHGGDAGNVGKDGVNGSANKSGDDAASLGKQVNGKQGEEEEEGPQTKSKGEGTGEKVVKTTGLSADGGNFDAAVAGAGVEADRLLDQKGIQHGPQDNKKATESTDSVASDGSRDSQGKKKTKILDKIKAKLPIHHKHHEPQPA